MGAAMRAQVPRRPPPCRGAAFERRALSYWCETHTLLHERGSLAAAMRAVRDPALPQRSISFLPSAIYTGVTVCGETAALRRFSSLISRYMILSPCSAAPVPVPSDVPPKRISGSCAAVCLRTFLSFIMLLPPLFFKYAAAPRRIGIIYGGTVYIITKSDIFVRCRAVIKIRLPSYYYYK